LRPTIASTPHPYDFAARPIVGDLATADIEMDQPPAPVDRSNEAWRKKHPVAGAPLARVDPDIANAPVGIVHQELLDMANQPIEQMNTMPDDSLDAAKMGIVAARGGRPLRYGRMPLGSGAVLDLLLREIDDQPAPQRIGATQHRDRQEHVMAHSPSSWRHPTT
jgi:hypothetical protein